MAGLEDIHLIQEYSRDFETCNDCRRPIYYCQRLTGSNNRFQCSYCKNDFDFPSDRLQAVSNRLYRKKGYPIFIHPISKQRKIAPGDLIGYQRVVTVRRHIHYAIVVGVSKSGKMVEVIEFVPHFPLRWGTVKKCRRNIETDIIKEGGWVLRYMPLDCLPVKDVLERAEMCIDSNKRPRKFGMGFNCQHLASWCKTGESLDLSRLIPRDFLDLLSERKALVQNHPELLYTEIKPDPLDNIVGEWSQNDLSTIKRCPYCKADFYQSSLISATDFNMELECNSCEKTYCAQNEERQRDLLMSKYGSYRTVKVTSKDQIHKGDVLVVATQPFSHHALVESCDKKNGIFNFIEYGLKRGMQKFDIIAKTRKYELRFPSAEVRRFLPLDCLPHTETVALAREAMAVQLPYVYDLFNCRTLCTTAKTGQLSRLGELGFRYKSMLPKDKQNEFAAFTKKLM